MKTSSLSIYFYFVVTDSEKHSSDSPISVNPPPPPHPPSPPLPQLHHNYLFYLLAVIFILQKICFSHLFYTWINFHAPKNLSRHHSPLFIFLRLGYTLTQNNLNLYHTQIGLGGLPYLSIICLSFTVGHPSTCRHSFFKSTS